jgi:hypothetical protein
MLLIRPRVPLTAHRPRLLTPLLCLALTPLPCMDREVPEQSPGPNRRCPQVQRPPNQSQGREGGDRPGHLFWA